MSISVELSNGSGAAISVCLTDLIGPGTTIDNQIATTSISPTTLDETDTLFTGLSLGSGSYYLVLAAPGAANSAGWYGTDSPTVATDAGVTGNLDSFAGHPNQVPNDAFPPASTFDSTLADNAENLLLTVTGDSTAPEPSSFVLAGLAGMFLFAAKLRSQR